MKSINCFLVFLLTLIYSVCVNASIIVNNTSIYAEVITKTSQNEIVSKSYQGANDVNLNLNEYIDQGGAYTSIATGEYASGIYSNPGSTLFKSTIILDNEWWFNDETLGTNTHPSAGATLSASSLFTVTDSNATTTLKSYSGGYQTPYNIYIQDLTTNESVFSSSNNYFINSTLELLTAHSYELYVNYFVPLDINDIADCASTFEMYANTDVQFNVPAPASLSIMFIGLIGMFATKRRRIC